MTYFIKKVRTEQVRAVFSGDSEMMSEKRLEIMPNMHVTKHTEYQLLGIVQGLTL